MKHFKIKLIVLFILIILDLCLLAFFLGQSDFLFTQIVLISVFGILLWSVFHLIDSTNKAISKFLFALKYQDYSIRFPEKKISSFKDLHHALNKSIQELKRIKEEEQKKEKWIVGLLEKAPYGILVLKNQEEVLFMNSKSIDLLEMPQTKNLNQLNNGLIEKIRACATESYQTMMLNNGDELSLYKSLFKESNASFEFIFVQTVNDLKGEIEINAWSNLFRVMTHEIMNSVTSISSLSSTLKENIEEGNISSDMLEAANSIEKRSKSLVNFTENYRQLNDIKLAQKSWFNLNQMVQEQFTFMSGQFEDILVQIDEDKTLNVFADKSQIEQVIINLILNAQHALSSVERPLIQVHTKQEKNQIILSFIDNGIGIPNNIQNDIFIPFYSSKKDGKGIGLSLCRKLMYNNSGSISLLKSTKSHTEFQLRFKV